MHMKCMCKTMLGSAPCVHGTVCPHQQCSSRNIGVRKARCDDGASITGSSGTPGSTLTFTAGIAAPRGPRRIVYCQSKRPNSYAAVLLASECATNTSTHDIDDTYNQRAGRLHRAMHDDGAIVADLLASRCSLHDRCMASSTCGLQSWYCIHCLLQAWSPASSPSCSRSSSSAAPILALFPAYLY
jgi:hypothetical protein